MTNSTQSSGDWTSGYSAAANVPYTYGYYGELNPLRLKLAFIDEGVIFPEVKTACELGYGQGLSVALHAAGSNVEWWGTDFTASQAVFAQELMGSFGASGTLAEQAFEEFCNRTDLPDFDFIGLHGIWSWISDDNRRVIVDFLRRKLKVGGVLYISYNSMPGAAVFGPMRDVMVQHAQVMSAPGAGILQNVTAAMEFAERLLAVRPAYAVANPQIAERIKALKAKNPQYVAHEYFNRFWEPMPFAKMVEWLAPAKLEFACSAHYADHVDAMNLNAEQQQFLADIPHGTLRETVRDFIIDQRFRRDYWVKGLRRYSAVDQREHLRRQSVVMWLPRGEAPKGGGGAQGPLGETTMHDEIYGPVLDALGDFKQSTIGELERTVAFRGLDLFQLLQALMVLAGSGHIQAAQDPTELKSRTDKLNRFLLERNRGNDEIKYLASPVTGGGFAISRVAQLFLLARAAGNDSPGQWAAFAWSVLSQNEGHIYDKDGKALLTAEESVAELLNQANELAKSKLPILQALGIA